MDLYRTRIFCHFGRHFDYKLFRINCLDDGARARDLCRDRISKSRNLLKQRVADGSNSAIGND